MSGVVRDDEVGAENQRPRRLAVDVPVREVGIGQAGTGDDVGAERAVGSAEITLRLVVQHLGDSAVGGIGEREKAELDDRVVRPVHPGGLAVDEEAASHRRVARVVAARGQHEPVQRAHLRRVVESVHGVCSCVGGRWRCVRAARESWGAGASRWVNSRVRTRDLSREFPRTAPLSPPGRTTSQPSW